MVWLWAVCPFTEWYGVYPQAIELALGEDSKSGNRRSGSCVVTGNPSRGPGGQKWSW